MMYPDSRISFLCDAGRGHFDLCKDTQLYIARFIAKALANPRHADGVYYSRWNADGTESTDAHDMFWYQDSEMVELTKARYEATRSKKMQYISAKIDGKTIKYDSTKHIKLSVTISSDTFTIEPIFTDSTRINITNQHVAVKPKVVLISGPAIQIGEYSFCIDKNYFGSDPKRLWSGITLSVEADGDDEFKPAVQELNIQMQH